MEPKDTSVPCRCESASHHGVNYFAVDEVAVPEHMRELWELIMSDDDLPPPPSREPAEPPAKRLCIGLPGSDANKQKPTKEVAYESKNAADSDLAASKPTRPPGGYTARVWDTSGGGFSVLEELFADSMSSPEPDRDLHAKITENPGKDRENVKPPPPNDRASETGRAVYDHNKDLMELLSLPFSENENENENDNENRNNDEDSIVASKHDGEIETEKVLENTTSVLPDHTFEGLNEEHRLDNGEKTRETEVTRDTVAGNKEFEMGETVGGMSPMDGFLHEEDSQLDDGEIGGERGKGDNPAGGHADDAPKEEGSETPQIISVKKKPPKSKPHLPFFSIEFATPVKKDKTLAPSNEISDNKVGEKHPQPSNSQQDEPPSFAKPQPKTPKIEQWDASEPVLSLFTPDRRTELAPFPMPPTRSAPLSPLVSSGNFTNNACDSPSSQSDLFRGQMLGRAPNSARSEGMIRTPARTHTQHPRHYVNSLLGQSPAFLPNLDSPSFSSGRCDSADRPFFPYHFEDFMDSNGTPRGCVGRLEWMHSPLSDRSARETPSHVSAFTMEDITWSPSMVTQPVTDTAIKPRLQRTSIVCVRPKETAVGAGVHANSSAKQLCEGDSTHLFVPFSQPCTQATEVLPSQSPAIGDVNESGSRTASPLSGQGDPLQGDDQVLHCPTGVNQFDAPQGIQTRTVVSHVIEPSTIRSSREMGILSGDWGSIEGAGLDAFSQSVTENGSHVVCSAAGVTGSCAVKSTIVADCGAIENGEDLVGRVDDHRPIGCVGQPGEPNVETSEGGDTARVSDSGAGVEKAPNAAPPPAATAPPSPPQPHSPPSARMETNRPPANNPPHAPVPTPITTPASTPFFLRTAKTNTSSGKNFLTRAREMFGEGGEQPKTAQKPLHGRIPNRTPFRSPRVIGSAAPATPSAPRPLPIGNNANPAIPPVDIDPNSDVKTDNKNPTIQTSHGDSSKVPPADADSINAPIDQSNTNTGDNAPMEISHFSTRNDTGADGNMGGNESGIDENIAASLYDNWDSLPDHISPPNQRRRPIIAPETTAVSTNQNPCFEGISTNETGSDATAICTQYEYEPKQQQSAEPTITHNSLIREDASISLEQPAPPVQISDCDHDCDLAPMPTAGLVATPVLDPVSGTTQQAPMGGFVGFTTGSGKTVNISKKYVAEAKKRLEAWDKHQAEKEKQRQNENDTVQIAGGKQTKSANVGLARPTAGNVSKPKFSPVVPVGSGPGLDATGSVLVGVDDDMGSVMNVGVSEADNTDNTVAIPSKEQQEGPQPHGEFFGFRTGNNRPVNVNPLNLGAAREKFAQIVATMDLAMPAVPQAIPTAPPTPREPLAGITHPQPIQQPTPPPFMCFTTGSNKPVHVNPVLLAEAKAKFAQIDAAMDLAIPTIPPTATEPLAENTHPPPMPIQQPSPAPFLGFTTGSNKPVHVNLMRLAEARAKFAQIDADNPVPPLSIAPPPIDFHDPAQPITPAPPHPPPGGFVGFSTASNKPVDIDPKLIAEARRRLAKSDPVNIDFDFADLSSAVHLQLLALPPSRDDIDPNAIADAHSRLADLDPRDPDQPVDLGLALDNHQTAIDIQPPLSLSALPPASGFAGFVTGNKKPVKIDPKFVAEARRRLAESDSTGRFPDVNKQSETDIPLFPPPSIQPDPTHSDTVISPAGGFGGFTTGRGKTVSVAPELLLAAQQRMDGWDREDGNTVAKTNKNTGSETGSVVGMGKGPVGDGSRGTHTRLQESAQGGFKPLVFGPLKTATHQTPQIPVRSDPSTTGGFVPVIGPPTTPRRQPPTFNLPRRKTPSDSAMVPFNISNSDTTSAPPTLPISNIPPNSHPSIKHVPADPSTNQEGDVLALGDDDDVFGDILQEIEGLETGTNSNRASAQKPNPPPPPTATSKDSLPARSWQTPHWGHPAAVYGDRFITGSNSYHPAPIVSSPTTPITLFACRQRGADAASAQHDCRAATENTGSIVAVRPSTGPSTNKRESATRPGNNFRTPYKKARKLPVTPATAESVEKQKPPPTPTKRASVFNLSVPTITRTSLQQYGASKGAPGRSVQDALSAGVRKETLAITPANAQEFRFPGSMLEPHVLAAGRIETPWNTSIYMASDGSVGATEMHAGLVATHGVDPSLVPAEWVPSHYRWIVSKLAAQDAAFGATGSLFLTPLAVFSQLLYRYEREVNRGDRPVLRKILEGDEAPSRPMVVFVAAILPPSEQPKTGENEKEKPKQPDNTQPVAVVEVSDGWYGIRAALDPPLTRLLQGGKISVGTKLFTTGADLVGASQPTTPLEVLGSDSIYLRLHANSTRRAPWHAKLGYAHCIPPSTRLSSIFRDGGLASTVDVVVLRVYPVQFMAKSAEGHHTVMTQRAQERAQRKKTEAIEAGIERLRKELDRQQQSAATHPRKRLKTGPTAIADLGTNGEALYELVKSAHDPTTVVASLSPAQREALADYERQAREDELASMRQQLEEEGGDVHEAVSFLRVRVLDYQEARRFVIEGTSAEPRSTILTVYRPTEELQEILCEGHRVKITSVAPKGVGHMHDLQDRQIMVHINATRSSRYFAAPANADVIQLVFHPRQHTPFCGLPPEVGSEFDTVTWVVAVGAAPTESGRGGHQNVYCSDSEGELLVVQARPSLVMLAWDDLVRPDAILAWSNLTHRTFDKRFRVHVSMASEQTHVTANGRGHLRQPTTTMQQVVGKGAARRTHGDTHQLRESVRLQVEELMACVERGEGPYTPATTTPHPHHTLPPTSTESNLHPSPAANINQVFPPNFTEHSTHHGSQSHSLSEISATHPYPTPVRTPTRTNTESPFKAPLPVLPKVGRMSPAPRPLHTQCTVDVKGHVSTTCTSRPITITYGPINQSKQPKCLSVSLFAHSPGGESEHGQCVIHVAHGACSSEDVAVTDSPTWHLQLDTGFSLLDVEADGPSMALLFKAAGWTADPPSGPLSDMFHLLSTGLLPAHMVVGEQPLAQQRMDALNTCGPDASTRLLHLLQHSVISSTPTLVCPICPHVHNPVPFTPTEWSALARLLQSMLAHAPIVIKARRQQLASANSDTAAGKARPKYLLQSVVPSDAPSKTLYGLVRRLGRYM